MNKKIYDAVKSGKSDHNIRFGAFDSLIIALGFTFLRQMGSHTMYYHSDLNEFMNIQPEGNKAKGYQVEQLRFIIIKYDL